MPSQYVRSAIVRGNNSGSYTAGFAGAGTAQVGASELVNHTNVLNSAIGATAYRLPLASPPGVPIVIVVLAGSTASALIYPPLQSGPGAPRQGRIDELAVNSAFTAAAGIKVAFYPVYDGLGLNWIAIKSAA
jgi:hypothetical protein